MPDGVPPPFRPDIEPIDTPPSLADSLPGVERSDGLIVPALPEYQSRRALQPNALVCIPMAELAETPEHLNSRMDYDPASPAELAESIRRYGILQPLVVRPLQPHEAGD